MHQPWTAVATVTAAWAVATAKTGGSRFGTPCRPSELVAPPRGWNSYDSSPPWSAASDGASNERDTLTDAAALATRLLPHGYSLLTLDSGWFGVDNQYGTQTIDAYGRLVPNVTQFPSAASGRGFGPLAAHVHGHGLKFGIWIMGGVPRMAVEARSPIAGTPYTAADIAVLDAGVNGDGMPAGTLDCPWNRWLVHGINMSHPGAEPFIASLAEQYAQWGVDMLKVDCVFGNDWFRGEAFVRALIKALKKVGRPTLISLSPGTPTPNATLAAAAAAIAEQFDQPMMARLTSDFWDSWSALKAHFACAAQLEPFSSRLFSPDLDMLPMGWIAHTNGPPRYSQFTGAEQRAMFTQWVIARAPLIWGGSPTKSNVSTYGLISTQAVLDVQNTTCRNGLVMAATTNMSIVWAAQGNGAASERVISLTNLADVPATVRLRWADISIAIAPTALIVRELWGRDNLIEIDTKGLSATLHAHDAVLVRIIPRVM
mmetsp:Transcript_32719/g.85646  ORF Transcript_32719/g.85646 Transcript_32719/m.85646 type:complete len:485 (-) Transcript_32719:466-1920(-)